MTERLPLVLLDGRLAQLPAEDSLPGTYLFATEAEFNAAKAGLPVGARVVKLWEFPDDLTSMIPLPDYARQETTNRAVSGSSWTVVDTGFVHLSLYVGSASSGGIFSINGKEKLSVSYMDTYGTVSGVFQVAAGDIVTWSGSVQVRECFFIPPRLILKQLPIVVDRNGSYSTEEVKTVDTWLDGRPVYRRTYVDTFSNMTSPYRLQVITGEIPNVLHLLRVEGYFYDDDVQVAIPCFDPGGTESLGASVSLDGTQVVLTLKNTQATIGDYALTVWYTRTG
jgi:hypothetical protein